MEQSVQMHRDLGTPESEMEEVALITCCLSHLSLSSHKQSAPAPGQLCPLILMLRLFLFLIEIVSEVSVDEAERADAPRPWHARERDGGG